MEVVLYPLKFLFSDAIGSNPRLALVAVRALADETDWLLVRAVRLARADGYNWAQIGRLLGVSRQAAKKRFESLDDGVGPMTSFTPPHTQGRTVLQQQEREVFAAIADIRRRREFESGDAVFW